MVEHAGANLRSLGVEEHAIDADVLARNPEIVEGLRVYSWLPCEKLKRAMFIPFLSISSSLGTSSTPARGCTRSSS